jgi:renalase
MNVVVVGAGIAGLSCARALADGGARVRVLERGRVVGGRLASKRFDGRYADIGAAYLVADDPAFTAQVTSWKTRGLARPWTDTFRVHPGGDKTTGPVRWAAPGGLRSLAADLAEGLDVHRWSFAQPEATDETFAVDGRVWLCGDAFGRPRVQTAWLSGRAVAEAVLA